MLPRKTADYRTLLWTFVLMPGLVAVHFVKPEWSLYLLPASCYLALAAGVIAHNHNHCPTFKKKEVNQAFAKWISVFYGYPTFAWVPTHNLNHHKLVNRAGDATITWRHTTKHNAVVAFTYFFVSSYYQSEPIKEYIAKAKEKNPRLFRQIISQYVAWAGSHIVMLAAAIGLTYYRSADLVGGARIGAALKSGSLLWFLSLGLPAMFALWTIMFFNYVQHVHADPWSKHNHSRTFTGAWVNFMLFNNGLHTAHHEHAGMHWSLLPAAHKKIEAEIDPRLLHKSFWGFVVRQYLLAPIFPSLGTEQVGRPAYEPPDGNLNLKTDSVDAAEAGVNAAIS